MEIQVNVDCADPDAMMTFYAAALGYTPYGTAGGYRSAIPNDNVGPKIVFQKVPEAKVVKNRMHLDLVVDDIEAEAARFEALGARRMSASPVVEHGCSWIVMADPEGNELCLCDS